MGVISFDVFDTCLARLCGDASMFYNVLSLKLQAMMGSGDNEYMRQFFVSVRANSEKHSLEETYRKVAEYFSLPCSIAEMVQLELDVEREMLVPIVATRKLIERLRQDKAILFIYDTPLPEDFVRELLNKNGFFREGDRLYGSETVKAHKQDGSLFRLIHEREGVPYRHWHHYGSHRKDDYVIPRRLGIRAHWVRNENIPYEAHWKGVYSCRFPLPSMMTGLSRAIRLQSEAPESQKAFVCDLTAPLMVAWICRVMEDAHRRGIQRLYFFARDTHSVYLAAKELKGCFQGLQLRYLFVSSQAIYEADELTLEYFRQEGLADKKVSSAIVDSHTRGGSVVALNKLLAENGYKPVRAYCLVGSIQKPFWSKMSSESDFEFYSPFHTAMGQRDQLRVYGMRILYEDVFSLNCHKRTVGYENHSGMIRPLLMNDTENLSFKGVDIKTMKRFNDNLVRRYASGYATLGLVPFSQQVLETVALPTFVDFVSNPCRPYLCYLHEYQFDSRPFVGRLFSRPRPIWRYGSIVYSLPVFVWKFVRKCLSLRKQNSIS